MSPTCARDIANTGSCVLSAIVQKYVRFAALVAVVVASLLPGAAVVWAANGPGNNEGRAEKGAVTLLTTDTTGLTVGVHAVFYTNVVLLGKTTVMREVTRAGVSTSADVFLTNVAVTIWEPTLTGTRTLSASPSES